MDLHGNDNECETYGMCIKAQLTIEALSLPMLYIRMPLLGSKRTILRLTTPDPLFSIDIVRCSLIRNVLTKLATLRLTECGIKYNDKGNSIAPLSILNYDC